MLNEIELIRFLIIIVIVSTKSNSFNYCYLAQIILFNINHFLNDRKRVPSIVI